MEAGPRESRARTGAASASAKVSRLVLRSRGRFNHSRHTLGVHVQSNGGVLLRWTRAERKYARTHARVAAELRVPPARRRRHSPQVDDESVLSRRR